MKPLSGLSRWRSVAALVAALVLLQALVLDRTEEKREEDAASRIDALPPGDLLATYISSLFLGSFRAIVVDMIWIELRQADAEKRVYRQKELLEWLAILQPRNEEVRQLLSWDIAFNIAETVNPRDRWQWEKTGILSILKGCSDLPHSIYLKWEVAQTHLYKKSFPIDGEFNHRFIEHLTNDRELQDLLQEKPGQPAQSPFELAIRWMTLARDQLRREHGSRTRTQVGRILDVYWADGLIRDFTYLEAMLRRGRGDYDGARMWLRKAEGLTLAMIRDHFPDSLHRVTAAKSARRLRRLTPILPEATLRRALESRLRRLEWVELEPWVRWLHVRGDLEGRWEFGAPILPLHLSFYRRLHDVLELERGDPRTCLEAFERLLLDHGNLDQRFLYVKASEIKRELSGDPFEINDREFDVTHLAIDPNAPVTANIFPPGDRDLYRITLDLSRGHPSAILVVAIEPNRPGFPLRVRATAHLSNGSTRDLGEAQAPILIEHPIVVSQAVDLQVTAPGASPVDPEESTYRIRVGLRPLDR
jgi:hypothetical protein